MAKTKSDTTDAAELRRQLEALQAENANLTGRLSTEAAARRTAEQANMTAQERSVVTAQEACDSRLESITNEIASTKAEIARLADEPGHGAEIADLQEKLADVIAEKREEANKKSYLAREREKFKTARERREEGDDNPSGDKLANGAPLDGFSPATQAWVRAHPRAMTDRAYLDRVIAFSNAAMAAGKKNDSPEFFAYVEEQMGESTTSRQDDEDPENLEDDQEQEIAPEEEETRHANGEAARPQRGAAGPGSAAAPVARQAARSSGNGGNRRTPALTADEREVANALYADLKIDGKPATEADRMRHYAKSKDWARTYRPTHFQGPN